MSTIASRILAAAAKLDDHDEAPRSPHTPELLLVFLRYLTTCRRRLTIENVREIVDDPPIAVYAELTAALSSIPRGSHAAALTSLRSKVRLVALANEMSDKLAIAEIGQGAAMQLVPSKQASPLKREFVDLVRDPLMLATAASLGFEAISHVFTILFIVLVSSVVGSLAVLALRGPDRYPTLHRFVFSKARRP